jgi:hypothetical protein
MRPGSCLFWRLVGGALPIPRFDPNVDGPARLSVFLKSPLSGPNGIVRRLGLPTAIGLKQNPASGHKPLRGYVEVG